MPLSILATKLYIPHPKLNGVPRARLTDGLLMDIKRPGTWALLSGPAGFGKNALLAEFIEKFHKPVAWLSLDAADNDPIRVVVAEDIFLESALRHDYR